MPGITDLAQLLKHMTPTLDTTEWCFCCVGLAQVSQQQIQDSFACIRESEGWTLITPAAGTSPLITGTPPALFKRIELQVHSSLEAVGLTAAVATALAEQGISANVVAAYHHDHIFVPSQKAGQALAVLQQLSTKA